MDAHVLGLGESLKFYNGQGVSFGVNDIWSKYKSDYVVCIDARSSFTATRLHHIENCEPIHFYSQYQEYRNVKGFQLIRTTGRYKEGDCDRNGIAYSVCSPFVACIIAYKQGAKTITLHGVDMNNHHASKNKAWMTHFMNDFKQLRDDLLKKDVHLFVGHPASKLSEILKVKRCTE
jgi:hypothetical protein